jgi:cyclophilin family peptidyl-prolyl cis-trans isomerase
VFGKVVDGMDVVDKIKTVPTGNKGGHQNVPVPRSPSAKPPWRNDMTKTVKMTTSAV